MQTIHKIYFESSERLLQLADESIDLVVTSPPYPMVEMWDESMILQNTRIAEALKNGDGFQAFTLMHEILNIVWAETARVVKKGGFVCINIGDATRTIGGEFNLYPNHSQIIHFFTHHGFSMLPAIIWRKPTNSPNKFMGSGMLPAGAYVTLEHEYILVFRKGGKRIFKTEQEKNKRQQSAYFWEERNQWFSDLWEIRGATQKILNSSGRERSGAYPFEIPYRLINMYSSKGDTVLDPFLGTGTTTSAAVASSRHSIGYEIDNRLNDVIFEDLLNDKVNKINELIKNRLKAHIEFVEKRILNSSNGLKHFNHHYQFPVMTNQETELTLNFVKSIERKEDILQVIYEESLSLKFGYIEQKNQKNGQQVLEFSA